MVIWVCIYPCSQHLRLFPNLNANHEIWKHAGFPYILLYLSISWKPHQNHDEEISVGYSFWQWVPVFINVAIGSPLTTTERDIRQGLGRGDRTRNHLILEIIRDTWKANTNMKSSQQIFCHQIFLQGLHSHKMHDPNTAANPHNKCWVWQ